MDTVKNLIEVLPKNERDFLLNNESLMCSTYNKLLYVKKHKTTEIIKAKNSYERRFIHIISEILGLYHVRCIIQNPNFYCREEGTERFCIIIGVKVSVHPLPLTKKDRIHRKKDLFNQDHLM